MISKLLTTNMARSFMRAKFDFRFSIFGFQFSVPGSGSGRALDRPNQEPKIENRNLDFGFGKRVVFEMPQLRLSKV